MAESSSNVAANDPQGIITSPVACMSPGDAVEDYLSQFGENEGGKEGNSVENDTEHTDTLAGSMDEEGDEDSTSFKPLDDGESTEQDGK
eukprot:14806727-Ditylum_brightwellii.AAC.1